MQELRSKRPFKIWDSWRNVRKGLVVSNFEELIHRGKKRVNRPANCPGKYKYVCRWPYRLPSRRVFSCGECEILILFLFLLYSLTNHYYQNIAPKIGIGKSFDELLNLQGFSEIMLQRLKMQILNSSFLSCLLFSKLVLCEISDLNLNVTVLNLFLSHE